MTNLNKFHVDANKDTSYVLKKARDLYRVIPDSFWQTLANGNFKFGPLKIENRDINRVHQVVTEIDTREVFYACGEDEIPKLALQSVLNARESIRESLKDVWVQKCCESFVQYILKSMAEYCTKLNKLNVEELNYGDPGFQEFLDATTELRLNVWMLVAMIKVNVGEIINPIHLPEELMDLVQQNTSCH